MRRRLAAMLALASVAVPLAVYVAWSTAETAVWREWRTRQRMTALLAEEAPRMAPGERTKLAAALARAERRHHVDPLLLVALIERESHFRTRARGPRGGLGLMQVRMPTARHVADRIDAEITSERDLFDPQLNVALGAAYLEEMKERFGSWEVALVAYNAGPTRVARVLRQGRRPKSMYSRAIIERWKSLTAEQREDGRGPREPESAA